MEPRRPKVNLGGGSILLSSFSGANGMTRLLVLLLTVTTIQVFKVLALPRLIFMRGSAWPTGTPGGLRGLRSGAYAWRARTVCSGLELDGRAPKRRRGRAGIMTAMPLFKVWWMALRQTRRDDLASWESLTSTLCTGAKQAW